MKVRSHLIKEMETGPQALRPLAAQLPILIKGAQGQYVPLGLTGPRGAGHSSPRHS